VIGTTLWTNIEEESEQDAQQFMMDYRLIGIRTATQTATQTNDCDPHNDTDTAICSRKAIPYDISKLHLAQKVALTLAIKSQDTTRKILVVTHHMPSYSLISEKFKGSALNCCFASNCDNLMTLPQVKGWIYGHTHDVSVKLHRGCICAVNTFGYPHENKPRVDSAAMIEI
jgi:hypothetical protein